MGDQIRSFPEAKTPKGIGEAAVKEIVGLAYDEAKNLAGRAWPNTFAQLTTEEQIDFLSKFTQGLLKLASERMERAARDHIRKLSKKSSPS